MQDFIVKKHIVLQTLYKSMNIIKTRGTFTIYRLPLQTRFFSHTHSSRAMVPNNSIKFTDTEQKIRDILIQFTNHYNQNVSPDKQLELRITGGWVRDKLMGMGSNDLDIAVNVLSGQEFATRFLEYGQQHQINLGPGATSLHTIKKNPEKSKHLETCTTKLFGLDIDFVNLRNEQYTDDSRVPIIECGTAEEDALRRDATLNALFYNLNRDTVEDFTGRGLEDLKHGILRTPLQPLQTFLDDPLRVLRLVRFASRFNFKIDPDTLHAMEDDRMKDTLVHKISRERVGVELDKILTSSHVPYGLRLLNYVGLTDSIFNGGVLTGVIEEINDQTVLAEIDLSKEVVRKRVDVATLAYPGFARRIRQRGPEKLHDTVMRVLDNKASQKLFWLCTTLQPYGLLLVRINPKKQVSSPFVEVVLKEGLRFGKHDYDPATIIVKKMLGDSFLQRFFAGETTTRSELGMYIRQFGEYFDVSIAVNAFNDLMQALNEATRDRTVPSPLEPLYMIDPAVFGGVMDKYEQLLNTIAELKLENVTTLKPLVDGKMLSTALQRKPGPWMSKITAEVTRWQLDHPEGTQAECIEHIREIILELSN